MTSREYAITPKLDSHVQLLSRGFTTLGGKGGRPISRLISRRTPKKKPRINNFFHVRRLEEERTDWNKKPSL